jgi:hypothetical protein
VLRALVAALAVANLLMLVWWLGWLDWAPGVGRDREPERLGLQVNPNAIPLIAPGAASASLQDGVTGQRAAAPAGSASAADAAASAPADAERAACLEAGPFAVAEVAAAERGLRELQWPNLSWSQVKSERGGAFIVYQGRFADDAALARRREELRRAQIPFDELRGSPDLQPGLTFGRFDNRAAADSALEELRQRGAKFTRVVTISPPVAVTLLRVERAEPALAARLTQLALPPVGASFRPCASPP